MTDNHEVLRSIYARFNARDIDGVLAHLAPDAVWANGMEGGHVVGHAAIRAYWEHQWTIVRPQVEPLGFEAGSDGSVRVTVKQSLGEPIDPDAPAHGLRDQIVHHRFLLRHGKVIRFDIDAHAP